MKPKVVGQLLAHTERFDKAKRDTNILSCALLALELTHRNKPIKFGALGPDLEFSPTILGLGLSLAVIYTFWAFISERRFVIDNNIKPGASGVGSIGDYLRREESGLAGLAEATVSASTEIRQKMQHLQSAADALSAQYDTLLKETRNTISRVYDIAQNPEDMGKLFQIGMPEENNREAKSRLDYAISDVDNMLRPGLDLRAQLEKTYNRINTISDSIDKVEKFNFHVHGVAITTLLALCSLISFAWNVIHRI